ncbi:MAG: HAD-IIIC family phosphatase [Nitrosomonas sp.]|nr:HAD-IIIC family phosphatase [Nitrosomonas sp.]
MFEATDYPEKYTPKLDQAAASQFDELLKIIAARSLIVWGEHCSECAAPACYASCSFYTPRHEDLNCGRFVKGIQKGKLSSGTRLATITFRKWGKLEGTGPVGLTSLTDANHRENFDEMLSNAITQWAPSIAIRQLKRKWDQRKIRQSAIASISAEAFVIEAWLNNDQPTLNFTLTILAINEAAGGLFQENIELSKGYNRKVVPIIEISRWVDLSQPYFIKIEPLENAIGHEITFGLIDFVEFKKGIDKMRVPTNLSSAIHTNQSSSDVKGKCVVWDLDNTVWQGTLAEDGIDGIVLDERIPPIIRELDRRGILQSIASKNDMQPALAALEGFGLKDFFLYPQISWNPKSTAIQRIAELLDIGLDTFVLVDDQAFERAEVNERLSSVRVLAETEIPNLLRNPWFDLPVTSESVNRRSMYQAEQKRKSTFDASTTDYVEFLRRCDLTIQVSPLSQAVMERAHELSQRTNQLNVSGRRYTREELMEVQANNAGRAGYVFSCRDRFGDYGIIAMCMVNKDNAQIESFMMSCRVQRKHVEDAIFSWLASKLATDGFDSMSVQYKKTSRNDASVRMLEELGFDFQSSESQEEGIFIRSTQEPFAKDDIVKVKNLIEENQN